jgi:hypothetical protein
MSSTSVPSVGKSPFSHLARNPAAKGDVPPNTPDEDDQDEAADEADDESGDGKTKKKTKKTKKAEDDSDDKDEKDPEARAIRVREKVRIRAIVTSEAGVRFPAAALNLALDSALPRHVAIETLTRMTAGLPSGGNSGNSLRERMAGVPVPSVGAGDARPAANLAEQIILAGQKRRGEI